MDTCAGQRPETSGGKKSPTPEINATGLQRDGKKTERKKKPCLRQLRRPAQVGGQHVAALPFGQARVQALLAALVTFCLQPQGFQNKQLRPLLAQYLGLSEADLTPGPDDYDLRRLRLRGLIERLPATHRYRLTLAGMKTALFYARVYGRVLRPGLSHVHDPTLRESSPLATAIQRMESAFNTFVTQQMAA